MQILFISGESQISKFLSGLQAEALMPWQSNVEIMGLSQNVEVTVICSGGSNHYTGTITKIDLGYQQMSPDGKWLGVKIMVRKNNALLTPDFERTTLND